MNVKDFISPQEWMRRVDNLSTGQLNHKLRSAVQYCSAYWEWAQKEGWSEEYKKNYARGQENIRNLLATNVIIKT